MLTRAAAVPLLRHRTGLAGFDAARWTRLPAVQRTHLPTGGAFGVLLQGPSDSAAGPVEVEVPDQSTPALVLVLSIGRGEASLSGTGAARPVGFGVRPGDVVLLPKGIGSRWHSADGREQVLHLELSPGFLADIAERAGVPGREGLLPAGRLPRDPTRDFLLRQIAAELRDRPPGWRRAVESAVTLSVAQILAGPRARRG